MDKQSVVHSDNRAFFQPKKETFQTMKKKEHGRTLNVHYEQATGKAKYDSTAQYSSSVRQTMESKKTSMLKGISTIMEYRGFSGQ